MSFPLRSFANHILQPRPFGRVSMEQLTCKAKRARELQLNIAQLCKPDVAHQSLTRSELAAAYAFKAQSHGPMRARQALQVARDLCRPESIHYVLLPQTTQRYLALAVHDMYMDLRNVVQNNLARKGPDLAGAEELRYENGFPNLTTGSVDLVVKAETSSHPKGPANHGVKGEVGSINLRGGRSTTFLFKFVATFIMAVWANSPLSLWPGMGMSAYFAYTIVGFKGQSNPVKKVMIAVAIESVIFIVMSSLDIRRMIFKIFPAWMMKATMAGVGMFLAFIGLQSGKGIDIIRDHLAVLDDLVEELENHFEWQKWLRELENTCEYKGKIATLQLRACQNVRHHLALQKRDRAKTNLDNELATNFANDNLANLIFKKKLVALLLERHFALATSFQLYGNKAWKKLRVASNEISFGQLIGAKELHQQLRREQLDCKDLRSASFRALCPSSFEDDNFKEETFKEETFTEESFAESSLEEETFSESSLEDSNLTESSLTESNLTESLTESFAESTFEDSRL